MFFAGEGRSFLTRRQRRFDHRLAIDLRLDGVDGPLIGTLQVGASGAAGRCTHDPYLVFKGGAEPSLFDFDHWRFAR